MTGFADQLFDDLMREYGPALAETEPAPPGRRGVPRPFWYAAGTAGAAGAITAGLTVFGGAASAYAVTQNSDGTVTVAIHQLSGIDGANSQLHVHGDRVVVVPVKPGCPSINSLSAPKELTTVRVGGTADKDSITVNTKGVPKGDTVVLGVSQTDHEIGIAMAITDGPVPSCVSVPASTTHGPGGILPTGDGGARGGAGS